MLQLAHGLPNALPESLVCIDSRPFPGTGSSHFLVKDRHICEGVPKNDYKRLLHGVKSSIAIIV